MSPTVVYSCLDYKCLNFKKHEKFYLLKIKIKFVDMQYCNNTYLCTINITSRDDTQIFRSGSE